MSPSQNRNRGVPETIHLTAGASIARPGSIRRSVAEEAHDVVHATEPRLGESSGAHRVFLPSWLRRAQLAGRSTDGRVESRYGASRHRP
jgi:hypothetical protein